MGLEYKCICEGNEIHPQCKALEHVPKKVQMTNTEIDHLIAEKVMGWKFFPTEPPRYYDKSRNPLDAYILMMDWRPTTDIKQAFEVVDVLVRDKFIFYLETDDKGSTAEFITVAISNTFSAAAEIPALAICKAALEAIGISEEIELFGKDLAG